MNQPTDDDIGKPVIHNKTRNIRQVARRDGRYGIWTKYRGYHDVNWANWELLERLPLEEPSPSTMLAGAGG